MHFSFDSLSHARTHMHAKLVPITKINVVFPLLETFLNVLYKSVVFISFVASGNEITTVDLRVEFPFFVSSSGKGCACENPDNGTRLGRYIQHY